MALKYWESTGVGQVVDVALADVAAGLVALYGVYSEYEMVGVERAQIGNASPYAYADSFKAKDGWIFVSLARQGVWKRFTKSVGMGELDDDLRFSSDQKRCKNREALNKIIAPWIAITTIGEAVSILEGTKVPCSGLTLFPRHSLNHSTVIEKF